MGARAVHEHVLINLLPPISLAPMVSGILYLGNNGKRSRVLVRRSLIKRKKLVVVSWPLLIV